MSVNIEQIHPLFAAVITGIDIAEAPTPETVKLVEDAMAKYAVVCIRGSKPDDAGHIRFTRAFGGLELPPAMGIKDPNFKRRIAPELFDASNLGPDGEIFAADSNRRKYNKGAERFHTDSSFNALPTKWSLLLGHIVPPEGGNTEFIDTRAVYDALDPAMKAKVETMTLEHDLFKARERSGFPKPTEEMRRAMPPAHHPLVRLSENGRKALFMGEHAIGVDGMDEEEGQRFLDELYDFATQRHFVYSHKWQAGDLVIWDNRCTMHRATPFEDLKYKRDMRRTTLLENGPDRASTDMRAA